MKKLLPFIVILASVLLISCKSENSQAQTQDETQASAPQVVQTISEKLGPEEFKAKLAETPNPQLIDVRTPGEVANGAIEGHKNFNFNDPNFQAQVSTLDKDKPVFVYCAAGGRSGNAATLLEDLGFKEVYDLQGGYSGWPQE